MPTALLNANASSRASLEEQRHPDGPWAVPPLGQRPDHVAQLRHVEQLHLGSRQIQHRRDPMLARVLAQPEGASHLSSMQGPHSHALWEQLLHSGPRISPVPLTLQWPRWPRQSHGARGSRAATPAAAALAALLLPGGQSHYTCKMKEREQQVLAVASGSLLITHPSRASADTA